MSTWYLDTETTVILAGPHCKTALFELIGLPWVDKICAYINILDVHLDVLFIKLGVVQLHMPDPKCHQPVYVLCHTCYELSDCR